MEDDNSANSKHLLDRQMQIIELVATYPQGMSFGEIQTGLAMPKATLHRMLAGLCRAGCLDTDPPSDDDSAANTRKTYLLGGRMKRLLVYTLTPNRLALLAQKTLQGLVDEFKETAFVCMLKNHQIESIAMTTPEQDWYGYVTPGHVMPPHAAASAKAILAFQDDKEREKVLLQPLPALTEYTITAMPRLLEEFKKVHNSGIAYCREEIDLGLTAIAAPIPLAQMGVVLSISIVGPTRRMSEAAMERMKTPLLNCASQLSLAFSKQLGSINA